MTPEDKRHLEAAEGWLGLGDAAEASKELESVSPEQNDHPDVLKARYGILAARNEWEAAAELARLLCKLRPKDSFGWIHQAYALHEMKRTQEAYDIVSSVIDKFPRDYLFCYNLACYSCQLGKTPDAWRWLEKAVKLSKRDLQDMAMSDPDLEPLWARGRKRTR